ncbi:uncharacterized protein LOC120351095 [Nilaparvata lugens]|uniref:uncharacterized protein LOC120351095 n=1 Tax=Nilaparvata lugens TaxID=108931 RepID=UPI00193D593F|nr:uncharacterized protein LOC120351095 [Nilaparvata lugens]
MDKFLKPDKFDGDPNSPTALQEWNFWLKTFENFIASFDEEDIDDERHGKGTPDGIGGTVKRTADRLVAEGKDIDSIDVLCTYLKENLRKIEIHEIKDDDIEAVRRKVHFAEVKPFNGTMKVHQVVQIHNNTSPISLEMKSMSCFKCFENNRDNVKLFECDHFSIGRLEYPSTDDNFQKAGTSKDKAKPMHNSPDHTHDTDADVENDATSNQVSWENIKPGKFILAEFKSEKKNTKYRYVCSVQKKDDDDGEVTVQGLKLANDSGTEFFVADENDISYIEFESILEILSDPKIIIKNRLLLYKFPQKINVYEKN